MDANKMRAEFEAAYVEEMATCCGQDIRHRAKANLEWLQENGDYRDPMLRLAYWAWQASREAVVVALPKFDEYPASMELDMRESLRLAIEARGLRVAP